uniref:MFS transporter n=1 Tax=Aquitalea sp. ASV11 TaxID=2795103 RepID=UPI0018ECEE6E
MSTSLNVEDLIDEAGFGPYQLLILLLCFLVMFLDGYDLAAVAYIVPSLMEQWGLSKPQLGQALSAALFGLAIGALLAGPLADRLGRKPALLWSVLLFGLGSLVTAWADSLATLTVYRLLTGIGLGAALPNTITLLSEYAPTRHRAMLVSAMLCGFPLGAGAGGLCAGWLLPLYGWPSLMLLGGIVPLLLCLLLAWKMPESVRYLVARQASTERIRRILQRISRHPGLAGTQRFSLGEQQSTSANSSWREVLSQPWT